MFYFSTPLKTSEVYTIAFSYYINFSYKHRLYVMIRFKHTGLQIQVILIYREVKFIKSEKKLETLVTARFVSELEQAKRVKQAGD